MTVRLYLLGPFQAVVDGNAVPSSAWGRRHAAALVKVLALADGRRLHREHLVELIWPGIDLGAAAPRLHKAVHYARRALGPDALHTGNEMLWLDRDVEVDVAEFHAMGERALRESAENLASEAIALYRGPLLTDDPFEPWTELPRDQARMRYLDLLRLARRWDAVLREEPSDEQAHLALIRGLADQQDFRGALRQFQRMEQALHRELGVVPSAEAQRLRAQVESAVRGVAEPSPTPRRPLVGRRDVSSAIKARLARASHGRGGTLLVSGAPGVGKTAVLGLAIELAEQQGFRAGVGSASAVEGPWPYAPVLEAFGDLCRKHPALLDGLGDAYRTEVERALAGRDVAWTGESGHQRLFVAVAELLRVAAAGGGLLLVVDDLQDSDDASMRLLHYLSRCAVTEPVLIVAAHRPMSDGPSADIVDSLVARGAGARLSLSPLSEQATMQLLADRFPDLSTDAARQIWTVSGGLPFAVLEGARGYTAHAPAALSTLPASVRHTLQRVALLGTTFTADELLACADVDENAAYQHLERALEAMIVEADGPGYRFRHPLVRDGLLQALTPQEEPAARRAAAEALAQTNAAPARVAHQFLHAGLPRRAAPYALRAVETAGALGANRDALALIDAVRAHVAPQDLPTLLARRGDLLLALGDSEAVSAYQEAMRITTGTQNRLVRARLARAASFTEDLDTARAAIAGLTLEGDAADSSILRAEGAIAYFTGDTDRAWELAGRARDLLQSPDDPWHLVDLVSLQGLIAHQRGEWFERFRMELRRTRGKQRLAAVVFDAHLCVAEYLLYGAVPYDEVIREAEELRRSAVEAGALRGVAFATSLVGEAALLMDDLVRAERELLDAVDLHRELDAAAGEAHSLQRLAEVHLARGRREQSRALLQQALPLARWSTTSMHLLPRIYGTMIAAADDPADARAAVDKAEATMGETDRCTFCAVMLAVPAAIACADVGDLADARRHIAIAEKCTARWEGTAWTAAVDEARAHLAAAEWRPEEAASLFESAARLYEAAGHRRAAEISGAAALSARAVPAGVAAKP